MLLHYFGLAVRNNPNHFVALAVMGYQLYYEREVPFELRSSLGADSPNEVSFAQAMCISYAGPGRAQRLAS